ncbi:uncharacterized protein PGTG_03361 [Puccinia graminis f. sp. tritici CRL 75-36-700-3]|uniref:DUF659 domain-containing protein n=1 Tax=Puccinia graminis f. sp. tritici (strain CRL 75-36-700-3 / race SCCL) TaxID=418459 RepID=E3JZD0_PUCGT|nr:uncharacterized protein PGTG_03361 [Puccinia graminis f. sp. tritici CRL 75-36-700-3]EFP77405.2 hypothetical protein PGTG_03361 [Puccinia graminis f. sp. tritici CRL 75-36-700-3]
MERRSKRIRRREERDDNSDTSDPPPMEPNEGESTASTTNHMDPDSTDALRLDHAIKLARNQVSSAYASYEVPTMSDQKDKYDRYMIAWQCKTCSKKINRPAHESSCGNLLAHAARCSKKASNPSGHRTLASLGVSGTGDIDPWETDVFEFPQVLQRCVVWCAESAKPFSALEEDSMKRLLHPTILKNLPNRKMISQGIHMLYLCVQEKLCEELKMHEGGLYLGVDAWQSPNRYDIIGTVVYRLVDDGAGNAKLDAMPLDFVQLKERHTGKYLAHMVRYIVEKFGLENRICGIVSDNASNNETMISELESLNWKRFKGEEQWMRCFAHIVNLIVKAILQPFARKKSHGTAEYEESDDEEEHELIERFNEEKENSDLDDDADIHTTPEGNNDPELPSDDELTLANLEDLEAEDSQDNYTSDSCRQSLAKFCRIAMKLRKSPNSKAKFIEICQETECKKPHTIERDVPTRWNSTYLQLASIVRCEEAIIMWQRDKQFGIPRNYHLQQEDFDLAADLVQILLPFYEITLQLSTSASARLADIVVMIDQITSNLGAVIANQVPDRDHPPALRNACRAGLRITNKYYSLTDCSPLYRIAMVLHPSFKDEYFKLAKWPKEWIDEAVKLTREMYNKWYKPRNTESAPRSAGKGQARVNFI